MMSPSRLHVIFFALLVTGLHKRYFVDADEIPSGITTSSSNLPPRIHTRQLQGSGCKRYKKCKKSIKKDCSLEKGCPYLLDNPELEDRINRYAYAKCKRDCIDVAHKTCEIYLVDNRCENNGANDNDDEEEDDEDDEEAGSISAIRSGTVANTELLHEDFEDVVSSDTADWEDNRAPIIQSQLYSRGSNTNRTIEDSSNDITSFSPDTSGGQANQVVMPRSNNARVQQQGQNKEKEPSYRYSSNDSNYNSADGDSEDNDDVEPQAKNMVQESRGMPTQKPTVENISSDHDYLIFALASEIEGEEEALPSIANKEGAVSLPSFLPTSAPTKNPTLYPTKQLQISGGVDTKPSLTPGDIVDSDHDGLSNFFEIITGSDPYGVNDPIKQTDESNRSSSSSLQPTSIPTASNRSPTQNPTTEPESSDDASSSLTGKLSVVSPISLSAVSSSSMQTRGPTKAQTSTPIVSPSTGSPSRSPTESHTPTSNPTSSSYSFMPTGVTALTRSRTTEPTKALTPAPTSLSELEESNEGERTTTTTDSIVMTSGEMQEEVPFIYLDMPPLLLTLTAKSEAESIDVDSFIMTLEKYFSIIMKKLFEAIEEPSDIEAALTISFHRVVLQKGSQDFSNRNLQDEGKEEGSGSSDNETEVFLSCASELYQEMLTHTHSTISVDTLKAGIVGFFNEAVQHAQSSSILPTMIEQMSDGKVAAIISVAGDARARANIPAAEKGGEFWEIFDSTAIKGAAIGALAFIGVAFFAGSYFLLKKPSSDDSEGVECSTSVSASAGISAMDLDPSWFKSPESSFRSSTNGHGTTFMSAKSYNRKDRNGKDNPSPLMSSIDPFVGETRLVRKSKSIENSKNNSRDEDMESEIVSDSNHDLARKIGQYFFEWKEPRKYFDGWKDPSHCLNNFGIENSDEASNKEKSKLAQNRSPPARQIYASQLSLATTDDNEDATVESTGDVSQLTWETPTSRRKDKNHPDGSPPHTYGEDGKSQERAQISQTVKESMDEIDNIIRASMAALPTIDEEHSQAGRQRTTANLHHRYSNGTREAWDAHAMGLPKTCRLLSIEKEI